MPAHLAGHIAVHLAVIGWTPGLTHISTSVWTPGWTTERTYSRIIYKKKRKKDLLIFLHRSSLWIWMKVNLCSTLTYLQDFWMLLLGCLTDIWLSSSHLAVIQPKQIYLAGWTSGTASQLTVGAQTAKYGSQHLKVAVNMFIAFPQFCNHVHLSPDQGCCATKENQDSSLLVYPNRMNGSAGF